MEHKRKSKRRNEVIMANYIKPVVFEIDDKAYGIDINQVQSIENEIDIAPVPNSVSYVKGIINLRGEVVPVYSLKRKFNIPDDVPCKTMIIISTREVKIALEVDRVLEISDIEQDNIVDMPAIINSSDTDYMDRVANVDNRLIILLDTEKLLSEEEENSVKKLAEDVQ